MSHEPESLPRQDVRALLKAGFYPAQAARVAGVTRQRAGEVAAELRTQGWRITAGLMGRGRHAAPLQRRLRMEPFDPARREREVAKALLLAQVKALALLGGKPVQIQAALGIARRGHVRNMMERAI